MGEAVGKRSFAIDGFGDLRAPACLADRGHQRKSEFCFPNITICKQPVRQRHLCRFQENLDKLGSAGSATGDRFWQPFAASVP